MGDDARRLHDLTSGLTDSDVSQLRAILGLPEAVATTDDRSRDRGVEDLAPPAASDDLGRRLDHLAIRVETMAGLLDRLIDRVATIGAPSNPPLTAEKLADIVGRMVRPTETRLETLKKRLDQVITALSESSPRDAGASDGPASSTIDEYMAMIGRALLDTRKSNTRQATDLEKMRRDLHRFDQGLSDLRATIAELPDRQALRDLYLSLTHPTQ